VFWPSQVNIDYGKHSGESAAPEAASHHEKKKSNRQSTANATARSHHKMPGATLFDCSIHSIGQK